MIPFFSIIIPLYNKGNHIKNTLKSVFNQTFIDFEVIIINDGSTDNSIKIVTSFKDNRLNIIHTKNKGVSSARNLGISNAKANYIVFLDADDLWYPDHLINLKSLIDNYPHCGLYATAYEKSFFSKKIVKAKFNNLNDNHFGVVKDYFNSSIIDGVVWTSAIAIPKKILKLYNGFNTSLESGEDTELWIKISLKEKVVFSSKITAIKVIDNTSNHLSFKDKNIEFLKALNQFKIEEEENKSLKKYLDLNRSSLAINLKMTGNYEHFKNVIKHIDYSNLNIKQQVLLSTPKLFLNALKKMQFILLKNNIYLSSF
ncbi:glycosyltransferase [Flavobacteriaceae bacterium AU392]|nr:glycosyltransferase family 2 protein [Flavobacteriaceae bacterium]RKM81179.1 glycosyltransferase [Flavobacteriaceae bacterium AU392]